MNKSGKTAKADALTEAMRPPAGHLEHYKSRGPQRLAGHDYQEVAPDVSCGSPQADAAGDHEDSLTAFALVAVRPYPWVRTQP